MNRRALLHTAALLAAAAAEITFCLAMFASDGQINCGLGAGSRRFERRDGDAQ